jgi:hypothetical protein
MISRGVSTPLEACDAVESHAMAGKQAVLLIHGIGFQRPMRTLRGFVDAVWVTDPNLRPPKVPSTAWSKPDTVSESFELRRLTTAGNRERVRTDFFEFYWAHLLSGTTMEQIGVWIRSLLLRSPGRIPRPLKLGYVVLWIVLILVGVALFNAALPEENRFWQSAPITSAILSVAVLPFVVWVMREIVGDAAVYLDASPPNIQARHEIRSAGVKLLKNLLDRGYDRVIVVGHSLGTVIGYDILKYAWAELNESFDPEKAPDVADYFRLQQAAANLDGTNPVAMNEFVAEQRAFFEKLRAAGSKWRVSDFITLGSPLAHAEVLLAAGATDLQAQIERRELPTCPPWPEKRQVDHEEKLQIWFERKVKVGDKTLRVPTPHHAALFAATVWTNLYFPCRNLIRGDLIGGPIAPQLGLGIRDVPVKTSIWSGLLAHTRYWSAAREDDTHIDELRGALALGRGPTVKAEE